MPQVEYVALTADTTEADLKQRREIAPGAAPSVEAAQLNATPVPGQAATWSITTWRWCKQRSMAGCSCWRCRSVCHKCSPNLHVCPLVQRGEAHGERRVWRRLNVMCSPSLTTYSKTAKWPWKMDGLCLSPLQAAVDYIYTRTHVLDCQISRGSIAVRGPAALAARACAESTRQGLLLSTQIHHKALIKACPSRSV